MNQHTPMLAPFKTGWYSFGLWSYRPCKATYCLYPYESIPPLPTAQFTGVFQWLEPLDEDIDRKMQRYRTPKEEALWTNDIDQLAHTARQLGLSLPESFTRFMASPELQDRVPSCTDCHFFLPETIVPCPGSQDGYLVRFLDDQQFVLLWYLYLTRQGKHCVLAAHPRFHDLAEAPEYAEPFKSEQEKQKALKKVYVCAPSFEAFLYRFWIENTIWYHLYLRKPLTEEQKRYLSHYKPVGPNAHLLENQW